MICIDNKSYSFLSYRNEFVFRANWEEPIPAQVRERSVNVLRNITDQIKISKKIKKEKKPTVTCCPTCCPIKQPRPEGQPEEEPPATTLTPQLQKASDEGLNFIKAVAFPSIPALLQDLWVYLELLITLLAFCLGLYGQFPIDCNKAFQYTCFFLALLSIILALIDAYIYFVEVGSCARAIKFYKNKVKGNDEEEEDQLKKKTCCKPELKEKIHMFFEIGRNVITELILYPILICDLFSFVSEQTYEPEDAVGRVDYSLFIIGSFYLILAVYIMRSVVLFGSIRSLITLPADNKNASSSLLLKFSIHACGQIFVHLMIILVVGAKINNENGNSATSNSSNSSNSSNASCDDPIITASPFLWVSIVLGWLLPLTGTAAFFIVNYYWMKEFSIDFWLNMISLLQGASFAEAVFGGDGISETKEMTLQFIEDTGYKEVKEQIRKYKSPSWFTKFIFPARVPLPALSGLIYDVCLIAFIGSLILTYDGEQVTLVILQDDIIFTCIFFVAIPCLLIANLHILILLNGLLAIIFLTFFIVILFGVFIALPVLLFVYFPLVGILGYSLLLKQLCSPYTKVTQDVDDLDEQSVEKANGNNTELKEL